MYIHFQCMLDVKEDKYEFNLNIVDFVCCCVGIKNIAYWEISLTCIVLCYCLFWYGGCRCHRVDYSRVCLKIAVKHGKLSVQQIVRINSRYAIDIWDLNKKQILSFVC